MVKTGSSYLSQSELPLTFGLGAAAKVTKIEVTWPNGRTRDAAWRRGRTSTLTIEEGKGIVAKTPLARRGPADRLTMTPGGKAFALLLGAATAPPRSCSWHRRLLTGPVQPSAAVTARENAYRANNVGVALLEQYDFPRPRGSVPRARSRSIPRSTIARLNLGIALFYGGDPDGRAQGARERRAARCPTARRRTTCSA